MRLKTLFLVTCLVLAGFIATASAQEPATILTQSGERISGNLVDLGGIGWTVSVNGQNRTLGVSEPAVIDFTGGGQNFPATETSKITAGQNLLVLRDGQVFTGPEFWAAGLGLALAYAIGGWFIQQGYASGPAEVVVGSMTTIDPLAAVAVGLVVLGEGARLTPGVAVGMAIAGALAAGGVAVLSRFHPDTQRHFATQPAGG